MAVSWFGGGGGGDTTGNNNNYNNSKVSSMKDAVKVLYPPKRIGGVERNSHDRTRFSTLLLEHGEKHIQDWAVIAYSSPLSQKLNNNNPNTPNISSSPRKKKKDTTWAANATTTNTGPTFALAASGTATANKSKNNRKSNNSKSHHHKSKPKLDKETYPSSYMTKLEGRLHLCSRSLVFEPSDPARGIVRCPFVKMTSPPKEYPNDLAKIQNTGSFDPMCIELESTRHFVCKSNNAIGPFESVSVTTIFRFTFLHSSPSPMVELCSKLFTILHSKSNTELELILQPMYERPFDPSNLMDVRERPLTTTHLKCNLLSPLQAQPGCVVLTQERVYFQAAMGVISTNNKAQSWLTSQLVATARRYHGLKDSGLELYWKDGYSYSSTLLAFDRKHEREQVLRLLPPSIPCHTDRDFLLQAASEWQKSNITNFEYLLILNSAGGRSFQDISRYPVFPWVIADYQSTKLDLSKESTYRDLTKPVGALNEERLDYFRQRYENMHDMEDPFFYGTHYSAAGYVLYYLVRSMPEHMLCLQNGKFDSPDRMFHTISHCFSCALTNHADVKELIPEFYNPNLDFDFLINARGLQLGATQTGDRVNDVTLPPWAKSPRDFLRKNAKALESEICTAMLPRWIDLIFGIKSRGDAAREACNLFHRYTYFGPSDLANMPTQEERFQAELQATEFGIVPDHLFVGPHPLRHETVDESFVSPHIGRTFSGTEDIGKSEAWELLEPPSTTSSSIEKQQLEAAAVASGAAQQPPQMQLSASGEEHVGLPSDATMDSVGLNREDIFRNPNKNSNTNSRSLPLSGTGDIQASGTSGGFSSVGIEASLSNVSSSSAQHAPAGAADSAAISNASAEWDIKFIERRTIHDDTISGCCFIPGGPGQNNPSILATTSLDGGLKVHTVSLGAPRDSDYSKRNQGITSTLSRFSYITMSRGQVTPTNQTKLSEYRTHTSRDPLACLAIASDGQNGRVAFSGGHDDVVLAYGINSGCAVASVYSHRDAVTGLDLLVRPPMMQSNSLWLDKSTHIMVSGSWDATAKVWSVTVANGETVSVNREPLAELFDADSSIVCVSAASVTDGSGNLVIAAGCADGSFVVWNLHSDGVKVVIHKEPARRGSGPCSVVKWSSEGGQMTLFTGFATGKVASFTFTDGSMRKASAASVGVAVQCLEYAERILLIGCADGGMRLIPIRDGSYFTSDLSLWPSVNNKSSPGLSSISISFVPTMIPAEAGGGKCICCTGAEDGSIALFELKKAIRNI